MGNVTCWCWKITFGVTYLCFLSVFIGKCCKGLSILTALDKAQGSVAHVPFVFGFCYIPQKKGLYSTMKWVVLLLIASVPKSHRALQVSCWGWHNLTSAFWYVDPTKPVGLVPVWATLSVSCSVLLMIETLLSFHLNSLWHGSWRDKNRLRKYDIPFSWSPVGAWKQSDGVIEK